MDLYKWAVKLGPLVPGELLLDAFELARDIRTLDMQASPYDLADWGYAPVPHRDRRRARPSTSAGSGTFAERGQALRERLLAVIDAADRRSAGRGAVRARHQSRARRPRARAAARVTRVAASSSRSAGSAPASTAATMPSTIRGAVSAVENTTASTMSLPAAIAATALATGSA